MKNRAGNGPCRGDFGPVTSTIEACRRVLVAGLLAAVGCGVSERPIEIDATGGSAGMAGMGIDRDASHDSGYDGPGVDDGGDSADAARGGAAGSGGTSGSGGTTGVGGGATGGSAGSIGGSGGATGGGGGSGGLGGAAGSGGSAGAAGSGTGGADGGDGSAGSSGTDSGGSGGGSGAAGTGGGDGGSSGTGGSSGSSGTGGAAGTASTDAGPDSGPPTGPAVFAVGSFTKNGTTGNQIVSHTLGQTPKALLLWTAGKTNETPGAGFSFGLGISDGSTQVATAMQAADGLAASQSARRMALKGITLVNADQSTFAEADLASWNASSFNLNWTTNGAAAFVIHYLAIGGPQVSAKVVSWTATTSPGSRVVTGVGFQPEVVLHFNAGGAFVTTPPATSANAVFGLGVMDRGGVQWSSMIGDTGSGGSTPSIASRSQKTDSTLFTTTDAPALAITKEATFISMDSGGFTVNFTANSSSPNVTQIFSLALAGVRAKAGFFNKSTDAQPASQPITTPGFQPGAVFLSSYQATAQTASVSVAHSRFGMGASDGTHQACSALAVADGVTPTIVNGVDTTSKVFVKVDNTTMNLDAEADLLSFDPSGFTLSWTRNDAVATQIGFLALGSP